MSNNKIDQEVDNQTSDLVIEKQVCFSLYSAANAIIRAYRPMLKALDLTYPQYLVMIVLWNDDGINVKELGHKLHLDSGTLTPLLKRLEGKELLTRQRGLEDERVREIFLTEQGIQLKNLAETIPNQMLCKSKLPVEELLTLKESCDKMCDNLQDE
ncbi:MarR family winged helix-turn-helix transcriptional regulator [Psychromonas sp. 14N.309.X.WAT.B.A12]|jgi:MarR family transcriptional regulator, organic hydroperoxide resistance regulator|uniref:MarR family winged helix-turn-helix transcriptional regulator n=1 Tax=unclassified Psychromonas TaxID=2614957 RepID=UPI0025B025DB|nr:MarR family transcriptional regulator [Psychromonas sp. 14N.309.X.WAT.B.A12]MDN2664334.1 MarR family transcriptional regulator [Psychromonas sp. 14N.309.X.WAT.B.A12]